MEDLYRGQEAGGQLNKAVSIQETSPRDDHRRPSPGPVAIDDGPGKPGERIYDLSDVVEVGRFEEKKVNQEIIVVDGRLYDGKLGAKENIIDLTEVVEEGFSSPVIGDDLHEEIMRSITTIAQGIAREMIPEIVERILREEIEKLKAGN